MEAKRGPLKTSPSQELQLRLRWHIPHTDYRLFSGMRLAPITYIYICIYIYILPILSSKSTYFFPGATSEPRGALEGFLSHGGHVHAWGSNRGPGPPCGLTVLLFHSKILGVGFVLFPTITGMQSSTSSASRGQGPG